MLTVLLSKARRTNFYRVRMNVSQWNHFQDDRPIPIVQLGRVRIRAEQPDGIVRVDSLCDGAKRDQVGGIAVVECCRNLGRCQVVDSRQSTRSRSHDNQLDDRPHD